MKIIHYWVVAFSLISGILATSDRALAAQAVGRPYLYYYTASIAKSHRLSLAITRNEMHAAGFESSSKSTAWEQFGVKGDTLLMVNCVPLSESRTYVQVLATSNSNASAKKNAEEIMDRINKSKLEFFD